MVQVEHSAGTPRDFKDKRASPREPINYTSTVHGWNTRGKTFFEEVEDYDIERITTEGRSIWPNFLITPEETAMYTHLRPSVGWQIERDFEFSPRARRNQAIADLSKLIYTVDDIVIRRKVVKSNAVNKYKALQRVFQLTDASDNWRAQINIIANKAERREIDFAQANIQFKDIALRYLSEVMLPVHGVETQGSFEHVNGEYVGLNRTLEECVGDNYRGGFLFGSTARALRGLTKKEPNDHDVVILTRDYRETIEKLRGSDPTYNGKKINVIIIPQSVFTGLMTVKPALAEAYEGFSLNGELPRPAWDVQSLLGMERAMIAQRHHTVRGALYNAEDFARAMVENSELAQAVGKYASFNEASLCSVKEGGYVSPNMVEEAYAQRLAKHDAEDPRIMQINSRADAVRLLATAAVIGKEIVRELMKYK